MNLQLVRYCYGPDHVAGLLKFGDNLELSLWTLECPWRDNQIFVSCVPDGSYPLVAFDSPEHPDCWVLTPVPGRTGILIHVGNTVAHTQGCILIGQHQIPGEVLSSVDALRMLNYKLDRNAQHTITLGSGLGAQLMPSTGVDQLQGGGNNGNCDGELRSGEARTPESAGGTD